MDGFVHHQTPAEYFKELIEKALARQKITSSQLSSFYLVHLLNTFVQQDHTYREVGVGENPQLAEILCRALGATGSRQLTLFKMTGDLSLFVSGFFPDSLSRKIVDVDYYAKMGGFSYGRLSRLTTQRAAAEVYTELSEKFVSFVDVLNEVSEASSLCDDRSLLRLYEKWLRTGSERSAELLREEGVLLTPGAKRVH